MTKLEACKEAARRDGASEEQITHFFDKIALAGAFPDDIHDEIPRGKEEAEIERQIALKRKMKNPPPGARKELEKILRNKQARN